MQHRLEASIVRIFTANNKVVGTGFLIADMTILSCAHVITAALGIDDNTPTKPERQIYLDFPLVLSGHKLTARVIFWQPEQANGSGDIAVLHLESMPPDGTQTARLVITDDCWDHTFRVFGFPNNYDQGVWASGKLRAREATGWVQIEDVKIPGKRVQQGFSGGAVWDEQLDGVAGMIVAADEDSSKVAYMIPSNVLITAWPALGQEAIPVCPYRGLFAFRERDASYFFGRETFTQQMVDALGRTPLLTIIGPSGSGKSSIVFAGLIPRLHTEGNWLIASFRPGNRPFHSLAAALMPLLESQKSETDRLFEINKIARYLQQGDIAVYEVAERIAQKLVGSRLLLVVDQFEELYTLCREQETRLHFLDELLTMVRRMGEQHAFSSYLVLTLRADFLGYALSYRPFADALHYADLKLGPMNTNELLDAIKKPAQKLNVRMEEGLTERILMEVSQEPGHLPLLEFALTLLWAKQQNGKMTHAAYAEIGGVEKALAKHAEQVYASLSKEQQQQAQRIFLQLVRPGEGTEDTRRLATRTEVGEANWELVIHLSTAAARLTVSGRDETTGEETVEVVHEALIKGWQRLREWVEANREFRTWQERLRVILRQWVRSGNDDGTVLRGTFLLEAMKWMEQCPELLSETERTFIECSQQYQMQERQRLSELYEKAEMLGKVQELDRLKDEFLITASHELRAPLTAVQGYVELIAYLEETLTPAERREYLERALRGCYELVVQLGNVMDVSRLEAQGRVTPALVEKVSVRETIESVINLIEPQLTQEQREVHLHVPTDLFVYANPVRLRQVLMNISQNALKYSPSKAPIVFSAHTVMERIPGAVMSITDKGKGVPLEDQARLFQRFVRLDRDLNSAVRGSGQGLYISRHLIEAMGGQIWVESSGIPGEGSTFFVALPLCED